MAYLRLTPIAGNTWPPLCDSALSQLWAAYLELDRTQWLSPAEIQNGQLQQARTLLAHCVKYVPYYRDTLPAAGIAPEAIQSMEDFRRIPLLPRRTYQEKLGTFVAEQLPQGSVAIPDVQTSGSSGSPTTIFRTNMAHLWWHAFLLRDMEWCGIDPTGTLAAIRSSGKRGSELAALLEGVSNPYWSWTLRSLIQTGTAHNMDIGQDHRHQLQWLRRVSPDYLLSYPSNLEVLAMMMRGEEPLRNLRAILAISDTLTDDARVTIETAFGVPVKNTYSCMEVGYLASPCPAGHGLHVHSENVILEVLDEAGLPCGPGQTGRVYITSLHNFRGPLVRYELGDEVTLGPARCECGRGLPLLTRVQGKNSPMFRLPDGRLKSSSRVAFLMKKIGSHYQHQVAQKAADHVVVRVVTDPTWTEQHAERVRRELREFFEAPIRVDVELHDRLPVPASGKFQNMVVEMS